MTHTWASRGAGKVHVRWRGTGKRSAGGDLGWGSLRLPFPDFLELLPYEDQGMNVLNMPSFLRVRKGNYTGATEERCTMPMSVNLIAPSKVQGCVLTRYIYIILLAALSSSTSKPIFSFFCFWKIRRIGVISRTFHHIPALMVLKLQFVMSEMLEDVTRERGG